MSYKLWSGDCISPEGLIFVKGGLDEVQDPGYALQLQQYTSLFLEKMSTPKRRGEEAQSNTQFGVAHSDKQL